MTLFNSIKSLIQICQFSGLTSYSLNQKTMKWESNPYLIILSIVIIIYNGFAFIITIAFNETFVNHKNATFRVILTSLVLSWTHVHALSALVEFHMKRNEQIKLLNMFESLDHLFKQQLNMHADYSKINKTCRRIIAAWLFVIGWFFITLTFYCIQSENKRMIAFTCSYIPSFVLCKLSYAHSILLVSLVSENIDVLSKYLKSETKANGYYISETFLREPTSKRTNFPKTSQVNLQPEKLLFMKDIYSHIWNATRTTQNLMCWSLAIGLSNEFFILLFNSYWIYLCLFIRPEPFSAFIFQMTLFSVALFSMFSVTYNYRKAIDTVSY